MIGDIFGSLLRCDRCDHGVGQHDGRGCAERGCDCTLNKEHVVQTNVNNSVDEHALQWRPTTN